MEGRTRVTGGRTQAVRQVFEIACPAPPPFPLLAKKNSLTSMISTN